MNKRILSAALLMGALAVNAQVGVGTVQPNESAELTVKSKNRGLLIPNLPLQGTKDITTITKGNVESLLVYNEATTKAGDKIQGDKVTPGYYYWHLDRWHRMASTQEIPQLVADQFETILNLDGAKVSALIKNLIKLNETLTILSYNPTSGLLTYTDEKGKTVTVSLSDAVQNFETVTAITSDIVAGTFTFTNEEGKEEVVNIRDFVNKFETTTVLERVKPGEYIYHNEIGDAVTVNVIGDLTTVIKGKLDQHFYEALKNIVHL